MQAKRDRGERLSRAERREVARTNRIQKALDAARDGASKAGVGGPYLLAFEPDGLDGHGRAVVSFGDDPYRASSVSWYLDGLGMPIGRMHLYLRNALGQLESTLREEPGLSAASIAYIGYETPSGWRSWRVAGTKFAQIGGQILFSDIRAFNAARDAWADDGSHFSDNHLVALSYGSTTAGYAGEGERLNNEVRTVSLLGSPGVGPIKHASGFGIGAENVFVASSSRDAVTQMGGARPGSIGRILGRGLGVDPAMDFFGAQRVTAEFPTSMDRYPIPGIHMSYHHYVDRGTDPPVRTESLANFGRIAAGHPERVDHEEHRGVVRQFGFLPRTHEPAVGRPLRITDDSENQRSNDRRWWDPHWHTGSAGEPPRPPIVDPAAERVEALEPSQDPYLSDVESPGDSIDRVARQLSWLYDRDVNVESEPDAGRVPPGKLFEAVGSDRLFATYAEVGETLHYLDRDSSAIVASDWSDRPGTEVLLAVNTGGTIHYYDPSGHELLDWPPPRGEGAVSRMAVGYLDANGDSVVPRGEYDDHYLEIWQQEIHSLETLSEADRIQLDDQKDALKTDFASALERGVAPGSDEANALAERDFALRQRLAENYGYDVHRYDARRLVTDGEFRDPYESVAPRLASYARDVIVANAERHLQPPDDPDAPRPMGPGDPGDAPRADENAAEEAEWDRASHIPSEEIAENHQPGFDAQRELSHRAMDQRVPVVAAKYVVNPLGDAERAVARARENATWMARLSPGDAEHVRLQVDALVAAHPREIGNAWGIPDEISDKANRLQMERAVAHVDNLRREGGMDAGQRRFARRVDRIDAALREVDRAAEQAGLPPPRLLAFDATAFRGDGRAVIVIGDDPYRADKVSWHIGRQKVEQLGETLIGRALDRLRLDRETGSAAAVVWIGNNTGRPVGAARDAFFSDRAAFRAVRQWLEETGEAARLTENRVYALSPRVIEEPTGDDVTPWLHPDSDPLLFAHRGAKDVLPENTWAAFKLGLEQGATALECDVHLTKDGHLVVIHDPWVNRTSDGRGFVTRKTLAELRELDFGGWHRSSALGDAQGHTEILADGELFDLVKDWIQHNDPDRSVTLFIETKHLQDYKYQLERNLVDLFQRHGLADPEPTDRFRVAVHSSHPDALALVHRLAPKVPTVLLAPPLRTAAGVSGYLWAATKAHADGISFYKTLRAFPEAVDLAGRRGLNVWAGVVHDPVEAQYVKDLGVHIIGSNHPALTTAWLGFEHPESALDLRVPAVEASELVSPLGDVEGAVARARANAEWMVGLSRGDAEQAHAIDALAEAHPRQIGNAWGVPEEVSDKANRVTLQHARNRADELSQRPTSGQRQAVERVERIDAGLNEVHRAVDQAGLRPPRLLAFDPMEFRHNGRAVIVIGDDPYRPETKVSWHVARQPLDQLGESLIGPALDRVRLDRHEGPAAAIVWIGKNKLPWASSRNAFYSDYAAFRAAREVWAQTGEGEPRTENHVYALSTASITAAERTADLSANPLWVPREAGPHLTAHRGGPFDRPEQTLAAYEEALRQGADAFEGDAQLTKDQQLVLLHGRSVSHSSDGTGMVDKLTLAELRQFDFGVGHPSRVLGEAQGDTRIMTVEQMLQFVGDHDRPLTAVIETKHWRVGRDYFDLEHKLAELLQRYGFAEPAPGEQPPAVVLSFWPESLKLLRRLAPELPTVYHAPRLETAPWAAVAASHRLAKAVGANGVDHYIETLRAYPEAVDHAARQGLVVWAREKNQRDAQFARDLGVSWMGTDNPGRLKYWLEHDGR